MDNLSLLREAAHSMRQSMYVNNEKKLSLTADGGHYHSFSNCLNALIGRGYSQDEVIKAIGYVAGQEGVWDEIHAEMGKAVNKEPAWKAFEKLSLGVHLLRQEGALIEHNEKITGIRTGRQRQIDISVRFKHGYYDYLSVVECKDATVTIEHVEAFRTKIEDVGAQKGVMISSVGFQAGAIETAKAFGIDIFRLGEEIGDWTKTIRQRAYEIPFPIEISFDAASLQTYLPITGGPVRYDEIEFILLGDEIIYLREIIVSLVCRLEEERVILPCRLSLEFPEGARMKHPAGELYVPVRSASFLFGKLRFNESSRVDSPPETLGYVFSDVLRGEINRIEPERVSSALRNYEGNLAPGKSETTE